MHNLDEHIATVEVANGSEVAFSQMRDLHGNKVFHVSASNSYNEHELLAQVARGNEAAFTQLFTYWHQLLAGYIIRITESQEITEEIVQDVFMKIWMTREALTEVNNFKHYLLVISRNQAFDVLKKNLKQKKQQREWEEESIKALVTSEEEDRLSSLIDQAIDSLSPRRREVWLLSRHQRLTYQQIADKLGIGKESVKTHIELASKSISLFIKSHLLKVAILAIYFFLTNPN